MKKSESVDEESLSMPIVQELEKKSSINHLRDSLQEKPLDCQ